MKHLFILLFLPLGLFAQNIPTKDGRTVYLDTIFRVDSTSKQQLYAAGNEWKINAIKNFNAIIELDDIHAFVIMGKASSEMSIQTNFGSVINRCHYSFKLSFKDNRCRLEVYDFYYKPDNGTVINGNTLPANTTYPSTWFLPEIGKKNALVSEQYRYYTMRILNDISTSFQKELFKSDQPADDW